MASQDKAFHQTPKVALNTQVIASDTTTAGVVIAMAGFEAATFIVLLGIVTAGDVTPLIEDADVVAFTGSAAVADDFLIGTETLMDTSNTVQKLGYVGKKGFVRLSVVTDTSADLTVGAVVVLEGARDNNPIAAA